MSEQLDEDKIGEYRAALADVKLADLDAMVLADSSPERREAARRELAERQEQATTLINDAIDLRW